QIKLPALKSSPSVKPDVEKVARDYYQNFNNIKGDTLMQTAGTIEFESKIIPAGSLEATITKYSDPNSYSWQAIMFQTEDFKEAVSKYKQYYRQLNGANLTFYDRTSSKLTGPYDVPDEDRSFASSILELDSKKHDLQLFKVEVALNYSFPQWTVKIMVYEKIADENMRPTGLYRN
ncbi:MAG TPA: hypothetical protein VJ279_02695, partial [Hanamia sp.]|nr:hypothetical protein [Hanamia sp.]